MASNKKTTEPLFKTETAKEWWVVKNCTQCKKYVTYNTKLDKMPTYRCAVQRDIECEEGFRKLNDPLMGVTERSLEACRHSICPYLKRKDGDVEVKHTEVGTHIAPKSEPKIEIKTEAPINILEQAEKMREERIAKAEKEERSKVLGDALTKMHNRRLASTIEQGIYPRENKQMAPPKVYINKKNKIQRTDIPPEVREYYEKLGVKIKDECNEILVHHIGLLHLIVRSILDVAEGQMQDCIREFKKRKMFRQQLKRDVNIVKANFDKLYNMIVFETRDIDEFFTILLDEINDVIKGDLTKLYYSIKSVLDKNNVEDSAIKAKCILTDVMFGFASKEKDIIRDRCKTEVAQIFKRERLTMPNNFVEQMNMSFDVKDPKPIELSWDKVAKNICNLTEEVDNALAADSNYALGLRILTRKFTDVKLLEEINNRVLQANPESMNSYYEFHPEQRGKKIVI